MNGNFDFGGFIDDDNKYEESDSMAAFEQELSVRGVLCMKYGETRGMSIYRTLRKLAMKAARENGGEPGLIFTEDGGHFVSFHDKSSEF
jgi:hypothetical protein